MYCVTLELSGGVEANALNTAFLRVSETSDRGGAQPPPHPEGAETTKEENP